MQETDKKDVWKPINYFSSILRKYQQNQTVTEKKTLAVIIGVQKFQHYLEGKLFIIETDHHALCQLSKFNLKLGPLHRWSVELSSYIYIIQYIIGEKHPADCFSRHLSEQKHRNYAQTMIFLIILTAMIFLRKIRNKQLSTTQS